MSQLSSTEREIVRIATRRVNRRVGFAWHAAAFVLVVPLLIVINLQTSPQYLWFFWPLGGWGLGLLVHAFAAFIGGPSTDSMVEREVAREMARRGFK